MCVGPLAPAKSPSIPAAPTPPPATVQADANSDAAKAASFNAQKQAQLAKGTNSTILTSPLGIQEDANTTKKKLLGQ